MTPRNHVLVHSGGGSNGAWGLGVMKFMIEVLGHDWPKILGTSVGALNGAGLGMYSVGEAKEGLANLLGIWADVTNDRIYKHWWPGGKVGDLIGVLWKDAVYNTSPVRRLVNKHFDRDRLRSSDRALEVTTYNLDLRELAYYSDQDDDILLGILASSSYPVFFQPILIGPYHYSDGGLVEIVPLERALEGDPDIIDVIVCQPQKEEPWDAAGKSTLETMPSMLGAMTTETANNDVAKCVAHHEHNDDVEIRIWRPDNTVGNGLDFGQDKVQRLIKEGYAYATQHAVMLGLLDLSKDTPPNA